MSELKLGEHVTNVLVHCNSDSELVLKLESESESESDIEPEDDFTRDQICEAKTLQKLVKSRKRELEIAQQNLECAELQLGQHPVEQSKRRRLVRDAIEGQLTKWSLMVPDSDGQQWIERSVLFSWFAEACVMMVICISIAFPF